MTKIFSQLGQDFLGLIYPNVCLRCRKYLPQNEKMLCSFCNYKLPRTDYHLFEENPVSAHFWGRVPIRYGASLFHYVKGGAVQDLVHALKYKGRKDIGLLLGRHYGNRLNDSPFFKETSLILPVPLHPKRERNRGYNQSSVFAKGLSESMQIPYEEHNLIRTTATSTQTKKSRLSRFLNVETAFSVQKARTLKNKHILLVDDVITTGATLEACILALLKIQGVEVSVATIATVGLT